MQWHHEKKKPNKELHNVANNRNLQAPDTIDLKKETRYTYENVTWSCQEYSNK